MCDLEITNFFLLIFRGFNPITNEKLGENSILMHPEMQQTFARVFDKFKASISVLDRQWNPKNAGKNWLVDEDARLKDELEGGIPINVIAVIHQRTDSAIRNRLYYLGYAPYDFEKD